MLTDGEQQVLDAGGELTLTALDPNVSLSTKAGGSQWDIFQSRQRVIEVFGGAFQLLDYTSGGLDLLVLRKRG